MLTVFVLGGVSVLAVEAVGIVIFIWWFMTRVSRERDKGKPPEESLFVGDIDPSFYKKQAESDRILKALKVDKATKQHKAQKEILEVMPAQKFAKIKNHSLILIESDGSHTEIPLRGCMVAAVSASSLSTRKWAKRYPIKVESGASAIYKGSRIFYIYLETSWEKESWCKALRLASCEDEEKIKWLAKLNVEFHNYLTSLNAAYPSFMKPSSSFGAELVDKSSKPDGSSSKVRQFLKKFAKKTTKNASENKASCSSKSGFEEQKLSEKARSFQDLDLASGVMKVASTRKPLDFSNEDVIVPSSIVSSTGSVISDADSDDRVIGDEGSLCWNLLISRLFFDAKRNEQMKSSLQERIQRTLSNIRSPSYVGEVTCAAVNVGDLPPYIHAMRVLPSDMNELWAFEIDVQYSGGAILDLETRLEIQDLDLHEGGEASFDSCAVDDVKSDLLEGFEHFSEQFKHSDENTDKTDQRNGGDTLSRNFSTASRSSNCIPSGSPPGSKWKSILHSVAKQVSQVPLSLGIRVASLRGTLRLYVKPPPSDQIWFGFTAMPDIDIHLNSSVGDRKISSGHLLLFITSRIKAAIRETVVLPNCENVCIPWMIAEKDDWIPLKDAPYIWINNKSAGNAKKPEADRRRTSSNAESEQERLNRVGWATQKSKSLDPHSLYSVPKAQPSFNTRSLTTSPERQHLKSKKHHGDTLQRKSSDPQVYLSVMGQSSAELHAPLLNHNEHLESNRMSTEEDMQSNSSSPSPSSSMLEEQNSFTEDDMKPKRTGTRARMHGLRKKMGEKLEEKKRHIEEKGRHLVGRIRSHKEYL
ncbi:hypothetical protein RND71_029989 [Anisodus tanguticus]|uniref:SMP-LTD domain-containing protein n=1 Tax=Anisodus tanguticus TaxID=243964 RepID=A0AAE1RGK8_9SOLA|nr:hypothetical protein RND71_029989 [Anisodus tanguticus]